MGLVDYSSEDSGAEDTPSAVTKSTTLAKLGFQKVIDKSAPNKIKVSLPTASIPPVSSGDGLEPPAKRPRLGGGGGFNSFLPAAKKSAPAAGRPSSNGRGRGLGSGVNLKTGSEAAFSREPMPPPAVREEKSESKQNETKHSDAVEATPNVAAPKGKTTIFRPLSVSRKPPKKKITSAPPAQNVSAPVTQPELGPDASQAAPKAKPKVSLFSMGATEEPTEVAEPQTTGYQPLLYGTELETSESTSTTMPEDYSGQGVSSQGASNGASSNSLGAIADDLNLTASQRRQLFGRGGKNPEFAAAASAMNVTNFNMDREYNANEELRAAGETPEQQHKAVRTVNTSGRNSLRSLVNTVVSQGDALEEHFAKGRRNKNEAGSKYGW